MQAVSGVQQRGQAGDGTYCVGEERAVVHSEDHLIQVSHQALAPCSPSAVLQNPMRNHSVHCGLSKPLFCYKGSETQQQRHYAAGDPSSKHRDPVKVNTRGLLLSHILYCCLLRIPRLQRHQTQLDGYSTRQRQCTPKSKREPSACDVS